MSTDPADPCRCPSFNAAVAPTHPPTQTKVEQLILVLPQQIQVRVGTARMRGGGGDTTSFLAFVCRFGHSRPGAVSRATEYNM